MATNFIQIVRFTTSRIDEVKALSDEFRARSVHADGGAKPLRVTVTADRDHPNSYATVVEFASYDEAMANSSRPETHDFAAAMAKLCDGPPTFYNLDVMDSFQV